MVRPASRAALAAAAVTLTLTLTACSSDSSIKRSESGADSDFTTVEYAGKATGPIDSFSWALYAEPSTLDWVHSNTYPQNTVLSNACEGLLRLNPDLSTSPALAESVEQPDGKTYVYKIRSGVKFHDGAPLTAAGYVDSKAYVESKGEGYGSPSGLVDCTGPFELSSWDQGSAITLSAYDGYWDHDLTPKAKQVVFKFYEDASARVTALRTGEIDGNFFITPSGTETLKDTGAGKLYYGKNPTVRSLMTWHLDGPLADPRIRQALSMAIDRQNVIEAAFNGAATPAKSPVSPDAYSYAENVYKAAYDAMPPSDPDIKAAKKLVEEAGAPSEPIVVASSPADPSYNLTALAVQAAGQAIGLHVEIKTLPIQQYNGLFNDKEARKDIDLYSTTWNLDIPDPLEFFGLYAYPGKYNNYNGFDDPEYVKTAQQAMAATDENTRAELTVRLQKQFVDQTLWIPLFNVPVTVFQSNKIAGTPTGISYMAGPWAAYVGAAK
ncbi:ABC transporter substrate-binding protein [Sphaerisporangium sp. NPDC051017]|uniref:ABC transporter substrate-binding protein n=1 Tax=Sphaerisporangium sp. NPDC051017 TaxID=3154636 RepID=UPI003425DB3A